MKITMTRIFEKAAKKLPRPQITIVEDAIDEVSKNIEMGELKKGDLAGARVYKFRVNNQLMLIAYKVGDDELTLLSLGSHENFYRDLKNR
jgi:mRNA-degrading endonuclease RelE of RelBE toxin-antitoxin system